MSIIETMDGASIALNSANVQTWIGEPMFMWITSLFTFMLTFRPVFVFLTIFAVILKVF